MFHKLTIVSILLVACISPTAFAGPTWKSIAPGAGGWITAFEISPHNGGDVLVGGDVLGAAISNDKGFTWSNVYGFDMTEIESFEYHPTDPDIVFAATLGGVYKSTDGGVNWAAARNGWPARSYVRGMTAPVSSIVIDRQNPNIVYAAVGTVRRAGLSEGNQGDIYKSTDTGETWSRIYQGFNSDDNTCSTNIQEIVVDPFNSNVLYVTLLCDGVWRSNTGGITWTKKSAGLPEQKAHTLVVDPVNQGVLYAAMNAGGIYKTVNRGESWTRSLSQSGSQFMAIDICESDPDVIYAGDKQSHRGVWKTTDGGDNWALTFSKNNQLDVTPGHPLYPYSQGTLGITWQALSVNPNDCNHVIAGDDTNMYLTENGGKNWLSAGGSTTDKGATWGSSGFSGLCGQGAEFDVQDSNHYIIYSNDGGIWQTWNRGISFERKVRGMIDEPDYPDEVFGHFMDVSISHQDSKKQYAVKKDGSIGKLWKTSDAGAGWELLQTGLYESVQVKIDDDETVFVVDAAAIKKSVNGGKAFIDKTGDIKALMLTAHPADPNVLFATSTSGIYRTIDAGENWELFSATFLGERVRLNRNGQIIVNADSFPFDIDSLVSNPGIVIDPNNPDKMYVNSRFGFWRSLNGGKNWVEVKHFSEAEDDRLNLYGMAVSSDGTVYGVTGFDPVHDIDSADAGIWRSVDGGETWKQDNDGVRARRFYSIAASPIDNIVLAGGACTGFYIRQADSNH